MEEKRIVRKAEVHNRFSFKTCSEFVVSTQHLIGQGYVMLLHVCGWCDCRGSFSPPSVSGLLTENVHAHHAHRSISGPPSIDD
jgi:hypothetical protein